MAADDRSGPWRLGTRASPLALAQAQAVRSALCAAHGLPEAAIALIPVTASGDRVQDRPLAELGGKALWTRELDAMLAEGAIDGAVHSAKDIETMRAPGLAIVAVPPRADPRDVLLGAASIAALPYRARVGTSAPRRAAQLRNARPDCVIVPFRGNVGTRLIRLERGEAEATLLASAGLARLGFGEKGTILDPADWLPAPGQGAIAVLTRSDDHAAQALLAAIDHPASHAALLAERALLARLGGGCASAVAALATLESDDRLRLRAVLFSPDGAARVEGTACFAPGDADAPAALADELLARSPRAITRHFSALPTGAA